MTESPAACSTGRIYVDLDDVLCHTARAFVELLQRSFGRRVRFEEIRSFDLAESFGLTDGEHDDFMQQAHQAEILGRLEPVEGAAEALEGWVDAGYEVAVVTGRPPVTDKITRAWLAAARIPHHSLTYVDKYSHRGFDGGSLPALSLDELAAMDFRLAVEDSAAMASWLAGSMGLEVLLIDRPWNRSALGAGPPPAGRIVRCRDWTEVTLRAPLAGPGPMS